ITFQWKQTDGPAVALTGSTSATPNFVAPPLSAQATLKFELAVNDGQQSSAPSETQVDLIPLTPRNGGGTGQIVYGRRNGADGRIYIANVDGSGETFITAGARPRLSPDGHYLAFVRDGIVESSFLN